MSQQCDHGGRSVLIRWFQTPLRDIIRGRITGGAPNEQIRQELFAKLPASAAELVWTIIRFAKLRDDESAAIARELTDHFREGIDGGTPVEALIDNFGDPRCAARLIRRAKIRCRSIADQLRTILAQCAMMVFAVGLSLYIALGLYYLSGQPAPSIDYLSRLNSGALATPEEQRAWPLYRQALLKLDDFPPEIDPRRGIRVAWHFYDAAALPRPGDSAWEVVAPYIRQRQSTLGLIRAGASQSEFGLALQPRYEGLDAAVFGTQAGADQQGGWAPNSLINIYLHHLKPMRKLCAALVLDSRLAAEQGNGQRIIENVRAIIGLARHSSVFWAAGALNARAHVLDAITVVDDVVAERPELWSDGQLQTVAHLLARVDDLLSVPIEAERMFVEDTLQRIYTDDERGDGRLTAVGWWRLVKGYHGKSAIGYLQDQPLQAWYVPGFAIVQSRREADAALEEWTNRFKAKLGTPLWELDDQAVPARPRSLVARARRMPTGTLLYNFDGLIGLMQTAAGERDAAQAAIALELYRRRTGHWPQAIQELTPRFLPTIPLDRYDGKAIKYRLIGAQPVVYSIGNDRKDDGGRPAINRRTGRLDPIAAREWLPPSALKDQASPYADGDWILWPVPRAVAGE